MIYLAYPVISVWREVPSSFIAVLMLKFHKRLQPEFDSKMFLCFNTHTHTRTCIPLRLIVQHNWLIHVLFSFFLCVYSLEISKRRKIHFLFRMLFVRQWMNCSFFFFRFLFYLYISVHFSVSSIQYYVYSISREINSEYDPSSVSEVIPNFSKHFRIETSAVDFDERAMTLVPDDVIMDVILNRW